MNTAKTTHFFSLHNANSPLLLNNIWDAASALLVQRSGAPALATSSASMAWSLGYADGQALPVSEMVDAITRIIRVTNIPLTVDIESGFSDSPEDVASFVSLLKDVGVVGINIEDGCGPAMLLEQKITAIRQIIGASFFINARTDIYLQDLARGEAAFELTLERLNSYKESGANGGFVPGITDISVIKKIVDKVDMPINIMVDDLTNQIATFKDTRVARLSVGPNSFLAAYNALIEKPEVLDYTGMNECFTLRR